MLSPQPEAPRVSPLIVMNQGGELENASMMSAPRATAASTHQR